MPSFRLVVRPTLAAFAQKRAFTPSRRLTPPMSKEDGKKTENETENGAAGGGVGGGEKKGPQSPADEIGRLIEGATGVDWDPKFLLGALELVRKKKELKGKGEGGKEVDEKEKKDGKDEGKEE